MKREKQKKPKRNLMGKLTERLDFPIEDIGGMRLEMVSDREATVYGAVGIAEYTPELVTLTLKRGHISFCGTGLCCDSYTGNTVVVRGRIVQVILP